MKLEVFVNGKTAGTLSQNGQGFIFQYHLGYQGNAVSLTMPVRGDPYIFSSFPPFFDGLLPEGGQLEGLLRIHKLDRGDYMGQLAAVGADLVGNVTVKELAL